MEKTEWTITENNWDYKVEKMLFTYSESEKQENVINKNNASLINYADFYPLYTWFMYSDLSLTECVILSYLYYWTKNWKWIYTSNDELARLTKSSRAVITKTLKHLSDLWYIDMKIKRIVWVWTDRKMKINVDLMRKLISNTSSDHTELISSSQTTQNEQSDYSNWVVIKDLYNTNEKNYIINNNTEQSSETLENTSLSINNSTLVDKEKEKNSAKKEKEITFKINMLISDIKNRCDELWVAYDKTKDRMFAKHILTAKEYWEFCDKIWQDREEFALDVLIVSIKMNYWKWALSWPKKIYQNYADLYNWAKQKAPKIQTPIINVL